MTSLAHANNRPALRAHWRQGFGEALTPDMPTPMSEQNGMGRLEDSLRDVPWNDIRTRHGGVPPERADALGLAPFFREAMTSRADLVDKMNAILARYYGATLADDSHRS